MTFNGLPLHPLVVHAVVVLVPLLALVGIVYGVVPRWRDVLRLPLLAGVIAGPLAWFAARTGSQLDDANFRQAPAQLKQLIHVHETWAGRLQAACWTMTVVWLLAWWALPYVSRLRQGKVRNGRLGVLRPVLRILLVVAGVAVLYLAYRTGDAGAKAVWSGYKA